MHAAMTRAFLAFFVLTLGAFAQSAQPASGSEESRVLVLEHMWNEAQVNRDVHAIQGMIGERFRNTEWDGEFSTREDFLADIRDPKFKPASLAIQDLQVNMYANTAVVTGVYHAKGAYEGKPYDHVGRFTDTWVSQDGKWLCVASHTSLLKK
jgi:ketosteroid isomerase-like protein